MVKSTDSLLPLRAKMGSRKLLSTLYSLVDTGVFDSGLRAWQEFPDLFPSGPPRDKQQVVAAGAGHHNSPAPVQSGPPHNSQQQQTVTGGAHYHVAPQYYGSPVPM